MLRAFTLRKADRSVLGKTDRCVITTIIVTVNITITIFGCYWSPVFYHHHRRPIESPATRLNEIFTSLCCCCAGGSGQPSSKSLFYLLFPVYGKAKEKINCQFKRNFSGKEKLLRFLHVGSSLVIPKDLLYCKQCCLIYFESFTH